MPLSAAMARQHRVELRGGLQLAFHRQPQVRPVERFDEEFRRRGEQLAHDFRARRRIGGRRDGEDLPRADRVRRFAQRQIVRAEIVAPLRDAMGFVDRQQVDAGGGEQRTRIAAHQPFRRHVEQAQPARRQGAFDVAALVERISRMQRACGDAERCQPVHLVAHQGDQWRHDDGEPAAHDRRQLVAERLAGAGRHDGEHVLAGEHRAEDLVLPGPQIGEAEDAVQRGARVVERRRGDVVAGQRVAPGTHSTSPPALEFA